MAGGAVVQWIGYQLDVKDFKKGISQKKVEWINKWVKEKTAAWWDHRPGASCGFGQALLCWGGSATCEAFSVVQRGVGAGAEHIRSVSKGGGDSAGLCLQRGQQITDERSQRVSTGGSKTSSGLMQ